MLVGSYAPDPEGGAERQCRLLCKEMTTRGFTVDVLTYRHSRAGLRTIEDEGSIVNRFGCLGPYAGKLRKSIEFRAINSTFPNDPVSTGAAEKKARSIAFWLALPTTWLSRLQFLFELRRFAVKNRKPFDLLHVHESGWLAGVGVFLGRHWQIPVVCKETTAPALHPIGYDTPFRGTWDRRRRVADAWLAQTPSIQADLVSFGIASNIIHLLPNGVMLPSENANPEQSKTVLYIGNLTQGSSWKAFDVLFDAWIRIAKTRKDAKIRVVGAGDPTTWIRPLEEHGVMGSADFPGYAMDTSVFYREAGIFVLPSRIEGMSNALLEAMSWGLPCVVSDIPGNRAVIEHEKDGLIVPVNRADALAEAVIRLMDDPLLRKTLGERARGKVSSEFDIRHVTDRLVGIYRTLLS